MRTTRIALGATALLAALVGCGSSSSDASSSDYADTWDPYTESPSRVLPNATTKLSDLVTADDVGKEFGVDNEHVPYPDTYWPYTSEGIDARWNDGNASPLEKAMSVLAPGQAEQAKAWEHSHHGSGVPNVADWWGHCPGWTGAAMFNKPILHAVSVKTSLDVAGKLVQCRTGDADCVTFEIGDINALEAEVFLDGARSFLGARCETSPEDVKRDPNGRVVRNGMGCHGLNAGALLVVLGNRLKRDHLPIAIDAQNDFRTNQIWNQPAYRYIVNAFAPLAKDDAIKLVANGAPVPGDGYVWNRKANGFVKIDIGLEWVAEHGPNRSVLSGISTTQTTRMIAVIELDKDASDPQAKVIGGEYIDDPWVQADRLTVPPFVWIARGPGPEEVASNADEKAHNPYLKPSFVEQLVQLGSEAADAPAGSQSSSSNPQ